ncbi:MAG: class II SORL domain-containing protein [Actinomycetota bacterium]
MAEISEMMQVADFKKEKHVPVIEVPGSVKKGEQVEVAISIGKEISHPNTTQHHIRWISLFFLPDGDKYPIQIGDLTFDAHGSSAQGADTSHVYTDHRGVLVFKTEKPGTLLASSYCNIHGLWQSSARLDISE